MSSPWLYALGVLEMGVGLLGLVSATRLYFATDAGMVMIYWPVLVTTGFLLATGGAILLRRPWGYYVHVGGVLLIGALDGLYLGYMFGRHSGRFLVPVAVAVGMLTAIFLLPPVRRAFGVR